MPRLHSPSKETIRRINPAAIHSINNHTPQNHHIKPQPRLIERPKTQISTSHIIIIIIIITTPTSQTPTRTKQHPHLIPPPLLPHNSKPLPHPLPQPPTSHIPPTPPPHRQHRPTTSRSRNNPTPRHRGLHAAPLSRGDVGSRREGEGKGDGGNERGRGCCY